MVEYNFSKDSEYHTQRNNKLVPLRSCNTTSAVMAMKQAKVQFESPSGMQDEDYLTTILESDTAYQKQTNEYPWSVGVYRPQEVHGLLRWGINQLAGYKVDTFSTNVKIEEILFQLIRGAGIMLSGIFDLSDGAELHHIVSLAGFLSSQQYVMSAQIASEIDLGSISHMILDDPYGDYRTDYKNFHGNNVQMPIDEFKQIFKKTGDNPKWAHIVRR